MTGIKGQPGLWLTLTARPQEAQGPPNEAEGSPPPPHTSQIQLSMGFSCFFLVVCGQCFWVEVSMTGDVVETLSALASLKRAISNRRCPLSLTGEEPKA